MNHRRDARADRSALDDRSHHVIVARASDVNRNTRICQVCGGSDDGGGWRLRSRRCEISIIDGVFTADPRIAPRL